MKSYLSIIIFFFLFSCQHSSPEINEVEFTIDKSLLSDSSFVSGSGFSITPPKNWKRTETYNHELQKSLFLHINNKLLAIYKSDSTNCAMIISEPPDTDFDRIKGYVNEIDKKQYPDSIWLDVQTSVFNYNTFNIIQIVFQNAQLLVFKLFFQQLPGIIELDFIIPRSEIQNNNIQSVESSIGSVKHVKN